MRPRRIRRGNPRPAKAGTAPAAGASMRPRRIRRGNSQLHGIFHAHVFRFNEAAANSPRKPKHERTNSRDKRASMRPRRIRRGNRQLQSGCAGNNIASMRPRRIRRGNLRAPEVCRVELGASMRPRRIRRGNPKEGIVGETALRASMRPRRIRRGNSGQSARPDRGRTCFNEAAANSPRKPAGWTDDSVLVSAASMRPRRIRRGNVVQQLGVSIEQMRLQ